jgi:tetratricopeptide (TPR) repeat protein
MNEPRTALLFFKHAAMLSPKNEEYRAAALGALFHARPDEGGIEVERLIVECDSELPLLVLRACELKFQETLLGRTNEVSTGIYTRIVNALHRVWSRMQLPKYRRDISKCQPIYSVMFSMMAACCRNIGKIDAAFHYYTMAVGLDPLNPPLLTARGAVIYGTDYLSNPYAFEDFQRAIMLKTDLAAPYYFTAHFLLNIGQFEKCLSAVEDGLKKRGTKRLMSEMLEFRAIALAALKLPDDEVVAAFNEASSRDVENERANWNLQVYRQMSERKAATIFGEPWKLDIDALRLAKDIPEPKTLQDALDIQRRMAG